MQTAATQGLDWQTAEPLSDREPAARLFPQGDGKPAYKVPDYEAVHREVTKPGVTQQLLWFEYCDRCRATGEIPYRLTQFKTHYREYAANTKAELVLNRTYQEMAEHYGTAIIPARVRTPKDKTTVEGMVGIASTFILAAIRNRKFFGLRELNEVIRERLHALNHKPFQKKDGSRASLFAEERASLLPLPKNAYEMASWKVAKVSFSYHTEVDGRFCSVPYE